MIKIRLLFLSLFLLTAVSSYAQKKEITSKNVKYGKISPAEFETKVTGTDSAASAVALFDIGRGWFEISPKTGGFVYVFERHTRYKILNKNGYDLANLEISLYRNNGYETSLDYMDAASYNMENGKMEISKINKDAKFTEKTDKNSLIKKFTLPNVKEGSIIEYKYRIKSDFTFNLRPWYFQKGIPVLYSSYQVKIPEYLQYKPTANGFVYLNPVRQTVNDNLSINGKIVNLNSSEYTYFAENVPALKNESYITTLNDYISKIDFELSYTKFPRTMIKDHTSTWPKTIKLLKDNSNFGPFTEKRSYNKTLAQGLIKGETNQDSIVKTLFNYVKKNIKWNDETTFFTSLSNPKAAFEKKSANSAEINLSLYCLLNEAGVKAYPVLLSTRPNGAHPGFPMLNQFNNVIVAVQKGEGYLLLDATDKNHVPGLIAYNNLNHEGFKIDLETENGEWISLENNNLSRKNVTYNLTLNPDHKFTGQVYINSTQYEGLTRRDKYQSAANETEYLKSYKDDKMGLGVKNYKVFNLNEAEEPLSESMEVIIDDNVEEAGNLIYFTPLLFERTKENPFRLEERKFPVDFAYPSEETCRININLPEGYQLESSPKNEKIVLPDETASFVFLFIVADRKIQLSSKITLKNAVYSPEEYQHLKELFKNIVRKQAEQIVLKKI